MASYLAIAAVARTVLRLLEDNCPRDEFGGATPKFMLYAGHDFSTEPVSEGFSVMVHRVAINTTLRNQPPRRTPDGRKRRPALPLDLGLMVTPWAGEAERQLRLMGWALRFIEDHAILPAALLNASLTRRTLPAFGADEAAEIVCDPASLPDYLGLWDKFRNRWQTSLTYSVRMVNIESDLATDEGALVQTRDLRFGQPVTEAAP
jgi:hypothetical protein